MPELNHSLDWATYHLSREVLALVGLVPGDYDARTSGPAAVVAEPDQARRPDALFITAAQIRGQGKLIAEASATTGASVSMNSFVDRIQVARAARPCSRH